MRSYSQIKAMFAITKASLRSILRSPSAIVFSILFPLIFILVFGFLSSGGNINVKVALAPNADTTNVVYEKVKSLAGLKFVVADQATVNAELAKGRIAALIDIQPTQNPSQPYQIQLTSSAAANPQNIQLIKSILNAVIANINANQFKDAPTIAVVRNEVIEVPGRTYRTIDFILPGQLGFSLLSAGVFGVAFLFFNLRQQLVLKRFYATPIRRLYIILGEALSRVIFQLLTAVIIIGIGHFAFNFTLVHGFMTFLNIMALSFIALVLFMGFGFIVSGVAKNESTIPPFANLITLPQFLLAGTFFSIDSFPKWLQPFCNILPLTHFNNAMREIAFEGANLFSVGNEIAILFIWIVIVYAAAYKIFKWE
ncbi:MAG: ABC transporter permease [Sediminibacterium sp.]|jgi:ABC-2 type transport system permease protein